METRLIVLTNGAPLEISHNEWPVRCAAFECGEYGEFALRLRQHADGRSIAYATHGSHISGDTFSAAGETLEPGADVHAALHRVALECRVPPSLVGNAIQQLGW